MALNVGAIPRGGLGRLGLSLPAWLRPATWAYAIPGSRDYRLDLLRGFLVFAMVVDHIGGETALTAITGNNSFLVSAAEGFIFISGLLMGIVYGGRVRRLGLGAGSRAVLERAQFLYFATTALTLSFVGLYLYTGVPLWMDRNGGLGVGSPLEALVGALTLHYTYHATDILLIYVLLVGLAPLVFYLLATGRTAYLMAGSWLLWATYQVFPAQADVPWTVANSIFPFAAWQALFYTGLALGYHRARLGELARWLSRPVVLPLLLAALAGMIALSQAHHAGRLAELGLPGLTAESFDALFRKTSLGPGRVLAFFVLAALTQQVVTRLWLPLSRAFGWLLTPLGQSSLLAYGAHLFLIGPFRALFWGPFFADIDPGVSSVLAQVAAVLLVWSLVGARSGSGAWLSWFRRSSLGPRPA